MNSHYPCSAAWSPVDRSRAGSRLATYWLVCAALALTACASSRALPEAGVIDMHVHVVFDDAAARGMSAARPPTADRVAALLDDPRIAHIGAIVIAPKGDVAATRRQNDELLELARQHPRIVPVASVHPADGADALGEIRRVAAAGARMLKLHQNTQGFALSDPEVGDVLSEAGRVGIPVLFEGTNALDAQTFPELLKLAATHPDTNIVLAHMGFTNFADLLVYSQLEAYPWWKRNVYFDLSATVPFLADSPFADQLVWTIRRLGADRVMFGSDFPVSTFEETLAAFDTLGLEPEERQAILYDTAARLLRLGQ